MVTVAYQFPLPSIDNAKTHHKVSRQYTQYISSNTINRGNFMVFVIYALYFRRIFLQHWKWHLSAGSTVWIKPPNFRNFTVSDSLPPSSTEYRITNKTQKIKTDTLILECNLTYSHKNVKGLMGDMRTGLWHRLVLRRILTFWRNLLQFNPFRKIKSRRNNELNLFSFESDWEPSSFFMQISNMSFKKSTEKLGIIYISPLVM